LIGSIELVNHSPPSSFHSSYFLITSLNVSSCFEVSSQIKAFYISSSATMPRLLLFLSITFLALQTAKGQMVTGKLTDTDGKPLEGAAVLRLSLADSAMQEGALTDANGAYTLKQGEGGKTLIRAQALGFRTKTWMVEGDNAPTTRMAPSDAKRLNEVEVIGQRPYIEVLPDKLVVNVAGSINATGNNGLDLMRKSPGVMVDKDENVTLKGKSVRILIDGKPTYMAGTDLSNYLKNLQAADIESIELISNPSAKYEASGSGGIINIKLKKNKNFGTNGSASVTYSHGVFNKHNQSLNLNNRTKKLNFFGNIGTYQGAWRNTFNQNRTQSDTLYAERAPQTSDYSGYNYKGGVDWYINSQHTLGILATGGGVTAVRTRESFTSIRKDIVGVSEQRSLLSNNVADVFRDRNNFNLNYRYQDSSGAELTADLDYGRFFSFEDRLVTNKYRVPGLEKPTTNYVFRINTPVSVGFGTAKVDYEQKLFGGTISVGGRLSKVRTVNTFNFFDTVGTEINIPYNQTRSNRFTYDEQIDALLTQYVKKFGEKLSITAGLRWEQTHTKGVLTYRTGRADSTFNRLYNNLFPSGGISYTLNKSHTIGVNYRRSIDRPDYESLNPFQQKQDDFSYRSGNPYLTPQFTHNVELTYTFMSSFNFSLGYSKTTDAFAEIVAKADERRVYIQSQNLARIDNYSANISTPIPIASWWQGYLNLNSSYNIYNPTFGADNDLAKFGATTLRNLSHNGYIQNTFTLGKGYKAELSAWGNTPGIWGGTFRTSAQGSVDIGLQKSILKDRGVLKASYSDILYTAPWTGTSNYGGIVTRAWGNWESQQIRISFDYRFGSDQIKGARNRRLGAEDLNNRVKSGN